MRTTLGPLRGCDRARGRGGPDDCIIVGAGPAGLTAAIYLARFHLSILLFESGDSRAASIPRTCNHAGFPTGISGLDLLDLMREQAERYGAVREAVRVDAIDGDDGAFAVTTTQGRYDARAVLLATGVVNRRPRIDDALHDAALARGLIRYCPICDGYAFGGLNGPEYMLTDCGGGQRGNLF